MDPRPTVRVCERVIQRNVAADESVAVADSDGGLRVDAARTGPGRLCRSVVGSRALVLQPTGSRAINVKCADDVSELEQDSPPARQVITARMVITPRMHTHHASKTSVDLCAAEEGRGDLINRRRRRARVCDAAAELGSWKPPTRC